LQYKEHTDEDKSGKLKNDISRQDAVC